MLSAFYNEQHEVSRTLQSMAQHHGPDKQLFLVPDDPLHKPLHQAYVPGFANQCVNNFLEICYAKLMMTEQGTAIYPP